MNIASKILLSALMGAASFAAQAETRAVIETDLGNIELSLDEQKAPKTVANFVNYANKGFYNGTIFHRVIDGFMIQGGGMTADMNEKATRAAIENEAHNGLPNDKYTIAMARTSEPHSASAQFFINTKDNHFLNHRAKELHGRNVVQEWGYAVFGKVVDGQDVVDAIEKVEAVVIEKAEIV